MSQTATKAERNRLRSSNITVVISISLVLFLLGLFGVIFINAQHYSDYIKERLTVEVFLKDNHDTRIKEEKVLESHKLFVDSLKKEAFVKKLVYVSKDKAGELAKDALGVDAHTLLEQNIYPASVSVTLKSDYVEPRKVDSIKQHISKHELVDEVVNDMEVMVTVYKNIEKITYWLLGFAAFFLFIVMVLINNSIKLKIYSKRFIIKTMQLVGAQRRFIIKPFLIEGFLLGLIGSVLAILMVGGLVYYLFEYIGVGISTDYTKYALLGTGILLIGIFISLFSTWFATWRFLHLRTDQLYY